MKPSFALDFRDGAIALLHRTSRGWQQVGASSIEAPDLGEALGYLRSTALGLSPRGLATKLVLPNDQILYTTVHAPGPDAAKRRKQIRAALEGVTPYKVDELAFDWWGSGPEVQVAVVAKETLAEAEAFAAEYRFNPVSFVAAPDNGLYLGEPFFGQSALSATLLAEGEKVERDQEAILVVARDLPRGEAPAVQPSPTSEPSPAAPAPESEAPAPAAPQPPQSALPEQAAEAKPVEDDQPATVANAPAVPADPGPLSDPQSDPEPVNNSVVAALAEKAQPEAPVEQVEPDPLPDFSSARVPPDGAAAFDPKAMAVELVDEAPMALDVNDDLRAPEAKVAPVTEPTAGQPAEQPKEDLPQSPAPSILAAFASRRTPAAPEPAPKRDTKTADFAKAAAEARARKAPSVGPAPSQRPSVPRPSLAKPASSAPTASKETLPFPGRNPTAGAKAPLPKAKVGTVAPALAALKRDRNVVPLTKTAAETGVEPSPAKKTTGLDGRPLPVRGKPRYLGLILTGLLLLALAAVAAWSSFSLSSNDADPNATQPANAVAEATDTPSADSTALPTAEEEALADGQDPAAGASASEVATDQSATQPDTNAAAETTPAETAAVETAPETGLVSDRVATATPGNDPQDEIFLAAADLPPQTSDAVLLPAPVAASDPPPQLAAPPPPAGTVYTFDADGRIRPTPEGIITPEGVLLVEGAPNKLPPARPAALTQPNVAAADATVAGTDAAATASGPLETFEADPALAGKKPQPRPEGLAAPLNPDQQGEASPLAPDTRFADIRPARRPEALTQPSVSQDPAAAASLAASGLADGTSLAIAVSRKPAARPSGMDQAVDAAVAAALQSGAEQPAAEQDAAQTASLAPEEQTEPEVESPAPDIPTSASVAKQATTKDALNLSKLALIGIFGSASGRYAMIRQPNGGIKRVKVGDTIDGGKVAAITATELQYQKGGRMLTLTLPKG